MSSKGTSGSTGEGGAQKPSPTPTVTSSSSSVSESRPQTTPTPTTTSTPSLSNSKYKFTPKPDISAAQLFSVIRKKVDIGEFSEEEVQSFGRGLSKHFSK